MKNKKWTYDFVPVVIKCINLKMKNWYGLLNFNENRVSKADENNHLSFLFREYTSRRYENGK